MFTGLIEEVGEILQVETLAGGRRFTIGARCIPDNLAEGDSVSVDGACMTAVHRDESSFSFEASPESLYKTVLSLYKPGARVNLERPLTPVSRIGGHFVTGHVDGLGALVSRTTEGNSEILVFEAPSPDLAALLLPKGSVAVMGVSLTVNTVTDRRFSVAIIPYTLAHTNLGDLRPGDPVNLEGDLLGKYVRRLLGADIVKQSDPSADELVSCFPDRLPLSSGAPVDAPALVPALNALCGAKTGNIRTGGWFNHDPDSQTTS